MLLGAATESRLCPGATKSGLANPSYHDGPRELYGATRSSPRVTVSTCATAPTVIADGALPGDAMPRVAGAPVFGFDAEVAGRTTTMMPARAACSTACTSGSVAAGS